MPGSILISNLAWSTPDGRSLIQDLDLALGPERTGLVGRNGVGKTTLVKLIAGELSPRAGKVAVDGRLGVLRQSVSPAEGETVADLFAAREGLAVLRRAERGEASEADLATADWTLTARIEAALARLGLAADPQTALAALSGGQRTRAALAALVFARPDFLVLDEPTNNLDREGREAVAELLAGWRAGALVVSHDRALLEAMDAVVELTGLGATRYGGGWSAFRAAKAAALAQARREVETAERALGEAGRRSQAIAERQVRKDAAGKRKGARGDMPKIVLGAMKRRAEATAAGQDRLAERREAEAQADLAAARRRVEVLAPMSVALASAGLSPRKAVLALAGVEAGYGDGPAVILGLDFAMTGPERVAVTGPNGAGKTTLLSLIAGALTPRAGTVRTFVPAAVLDQQAALLDRDETIRENFRRLNPAADENACRAALARFRFRAEAALQTVGALSGGEMLRAGLACVLGGPSPPQLLILDEPTNHLDLDALEAVEAGLAAYDGALLVVSHDEAFLEAVGITRRLVMDRPGG